MNIGLIDFENNGLDLYVRVVNLENDKDTLFDLGKIPKLIMLEHRIILILMLT
ncbi:hypothetical protein [Cytobacillus solani]|uniref:hypothetical protein n=1 Tax=Cytobacillus solani TaxID=1637975 RepID=UPI000B041040|nr:hypothetical protein [Cytobacillus solani]